MKAITDYKHFSGKHQSKTISENDKRLKMPMVKDLMRVHFNTIDKEIWLSVTFNILR